MLGHMSLFAGMRLHSLILAAAMHAPVVPLAYAPKVRHFARMLGLADETFEFAGFTAERFADALVARLGAARGDARAPGPGGRGREGARPRRVRRLRRALHRPGGRRGAAMTLPATLVDAHAHLHACFGLEAFLDGAWDGFQRAAADLGRPLDCGVLLLTQTAGDERFERLVVEATPQGSARGGRPGWSIARTGEPESLAARRADGARLLIVCGRQLRTAEGLELLALATCARFADGQPLAAALRGVEAAGAIPVLPWGVGKWTGKRGRIVGGLIDAGRPGLACRRQRQPAAALARAGAAAPRPQPRDARAPRQRPPAAGVGGGARRPLRLRARRRARRGPARSGPRAPPCRPADAGSSPTAASSPPGASPQPGAPAAARLRCPGRPVAAVGSGGNRGNPAALQSPLPPFRKGGCSGPFRRRSPYRGSTR